MKNPCDNCLIKINCTQICPDKKNFQTLLYRAIKNYRYGIHATTPHQKKLFATYRLLEDQNQRDMRDITNRKRKLSSTDNFQTEKKTIYKKKRQLKGTWSIKF